VASPVGRRSLAPRGAVVILAPAKINLGLAVLGRRADGYHELLTLFQAVSLCDRVVLRRRRSGIRVNCPALAGLGADNLAHRAAALFFEMTGAAGGVEIDIEKRIPAGGGLGGGSSDAAAALLGCCRLFGVRPTGEQLRGWAATLGSDVPFFVDGGAAVGAGRGELVQPIEAWRGEATALIHIPPEGLSTPAVYGRLDPAGLTGDRRRFSILLARWRDGDLRLLGAAVFNDLEAAAFALDPRLAAVKDAFRAAGAAGALLCGSGSSVVGLFAAAATAGRAERVLRGRFPGRFVRTHFLGSRKRWGVVKR
jgi:4-diphosphocytidyl-2-C-methyl-D-erythritol kinase